MFRGTFTNRIALIGAALILFACLTERDEASMPQAKKSASEDSANITTGKSYTLRRRVNGKVVEKTFGGPNVLWKIGVGGYGSDEGFVVMRTFTLKDYNTNKLRAPGRDISVIGPGNTPVGWHFDRGDKIVSIDGYLIQSVNDLVLVINASPNLPTLPIEFIDSTSGNTETGTIDAAKIRP